MELKESKTLESLARGFAGECQAGARYQFLSQLALQEQNQYISSTLKMLAKNEMAHAKVFFDIITNDCKGIVNNIDIKGGYPFKAGTLLDGLKFEAENELFTEESVYPSFAKIAKDEGFNHISKIFLEVAKVEGEHKVILQKLYSGLKSGKLYKSADPVDWKCSQCGYVGTGKSCWETCPLCNLPKGYAVVPGIIE